MTINDSALSALQSQLTTTGLAANLAEILADPIQELIEAQLVASIGAEPHERTLSRTNLRNGHRPQTVSTPAGDIEVKIPNSAKARFSQSCSNRDAGSTKPYGR